MEEKGIPAVLETWNTQDIKGIAETSFLRNGVPKVRQVLTPPDTTVTSLKEYIPQFIDALTRPLTEEEQWSGIHKPPKTPRILTTGTYDEVQAYFEGDLTRFTAIAPHAWMTDGLPITPPTEDRVAEMLEGTSHPPDEVIEIEEGGQLKSLPTVEKVAINAVMAGCKPEYMPVLLAMLEMGARQGGTSDCSNGAAYVVSGPIAKDIGMNSGIELFAPGNPANMGISRACVLMTINLTATEVAIDTIGRMGTYLWGLTWAESEDTPWIGLNEDEGFGADESVLVRLAGHVNLIPPCTSGMVKTPKDLFEFQNSSPEALVAALTTPTENLGSIVLFTPDTANNWREIYGFKTMQQLKDYLWENVTRSKSELFEHYRFFALSLEAEQNERGSKQLNPDHLDLPGDAQMPFIFRGPKSIKIVVAGGIGDAWGWGTYFHRDPISTSIDKWR